jgi:hypothetical protein
MFPSMVGNNEIGFDCFGWLRGEFGVIVQEGLWA